VTAIMLIGGVDGLREAAAATSTIPILYAGGADPVKIGLAATLNRPSGNITGTTIILNLPAGKRLDLLLKLRPEVTTVGCSTGDRVDGEVDAYWKQRVVARNAHESLRVVGPATGSTWLARAAAADAASRRVVRVHAGAGHVRGRAEGG
jgi:hypothetical protein